MTITVEQERKLDRFVSNEIHARVNNLVEFSINQSLEGNDDAPISIDDFENLYRYPEFYSKYAAFPGGNEEELKEEIERLESILFEEMDKEGGHDSDLDDEIDALKDLEEEPQEIFEYWLISLSLANDLERKGEPVAKVGGVGYIWGRTCTGQAISMDSVIQEIYEELNK